MGKHWDHILSIFKRGKVFWIKWETFVTYNTWRHLFIYKTQAFVKYFYLLSSNGQDNCNIDDMCGVKFLTFTHT